MVLDFYNLREQPFGVTPDPRYLYMSPTHREAAASLSYGIASGRGFLGLIASPGMGKTTLLRHLLQRVSSSARTAFVFQTQCSPKSFLRQLMSELNIEEAGADSASMQSRLNDELIREARSGRKVVIVVDEAQNLGRPVLEVLRMLSNFETATDKLLHIILAGQPQLADKLESESLVQLRQRISIISRLEVFTAFETKEYIEHRLRIAGYGLEDRLFSPGAIHLIAEASGGIPRNINNICFNALSLGCVLRQAPIRREVILDVLKDLDLNRLRSGAAVHCDIPSMTARQHVTAKASRTWRQKWVPRFALAGAFIALAGWTLTRGRPPGQPELLSAPASKQAYASAPHAGSHGDGNTVNKSDVAAVSAIHGKDPILVHPVDLAAINPAAPVKFVRVARDETLSGIVIQNLGRARRGDMRKIRELNPWLRDPDRIEAGQTILIPVSDRQHDAGHRTAGTVQEDSVLEAQKP
jgi:general secretion pathway protein A